MLTLLLRFRSFFFAAAALAATGCAGHDVNAIPAIPAAAVPAAHRTIAGDVKRARTTTATSALIANLSAQISGNQLADGAIINEGSILGYYGNYSAIGLVKAHNYAGAQAWAQWYVAHLNAPNTWGAGCSEYDYSYVNGVETSTNTAESVDAHGASFLTLLRVMYQSGNSGLVTYVSGLRPQAECVAASIVALMAPNHLTQVLPGDGNEYLMDNAQVYRGFADLSWLESNVWSNSTGATTYKNDAATIAQGIASLWNSSLNMYAPATSVRGNLQTPTWSTWYSASTAQLFPVVNGVIPPGGTRAIGLYKAFNAAWPCWTTPGACDPNKLPWAVIAQAAAAMGDTTRLALYTTNAQSRFGQYFQFGNWYPAESTALISAYTTPVFQ
jgi:hypothetical protein